MSASPVRQANRLLQGCFAGHGGYTLANTTRTQLVQLLLRCRHAAKPCRKRIRSCDQEYSRQTIAQLGRLPSALRATQLRQGQDLASLAPFGFRGVLGPHRQGLGEQGACAEPPEQTGRHGAGQSIDHQMEIAASSRRTRVTSSAVSS